MASAQAVAQEYFALHARPTTPSILIPFTQNEVQKLFALPLVRMDIQAEFNVSTAFVKVVGTWRNIAHFKSDCIFCLPLEGTVTEVSIKIQQNIKQRALETLIIPKKDAEEMAAEQAEAKNSLLGEDTNDESEVPMQGQLPEMKFDDYIPALFRLPIEEVMPGDLVTVTAIFIEPMVFMDGRYKFKMNLKFPKSLVAKDEKQQPYDIDTVMNIHCVINSVNPDAVVHSDTHTLKKEDKKSTNQEIGTENAMIVDVVSFRPNL